MKLQEYLDTIETEADKISSKKDVRKYSANIGKINKKALLDSDISKEEYGRIVDKGYTACALRLWELGIS